MTNLQQYETTSKIRNFKPSCCSGKEANKAVWVIAYPVSGRECITFLTLIHYLVVYPSIIINGNVGAYIINLVITLRI
jgi:hypothetical protein